MPSHQFYVWAYYYGLWEHNCSIAGQAFDKLPKPRLRIFNYSSPFSSPPAQSRSGRLYNNCYYPLLFYWSNSFLWVVALHTQIVVPIWTPLVSWENSKQGSICNHFSSKAGNALSSGRSWPLLGNWMCFCGFYYWITLSCVRLAVIVPYKLGLSTSGLCHFAKLTACSVPILCYCITVIFLTTCKTEGLAHFWHILEVYYSTHNNAKISFSSFHIYYKKTSLFQHKTIVSNLSLESRDKNFSW